MWISCQCTHVTIGIMCDMGDYLIVILRFSIVRAIHTFQISFLHVGYTDYNNNNNYSTAAKQSKWPKRKKNNNNICRTSHRNRTNWTVVINPLTHTASFGREKKFHSLVYFVNYPNYRVQEACKLKNRLSIWWFSSRIECELQTDSKSHIKSVDIVKNNISFHHLKQF